MITNPRSWLPQNLVDLYDHLRFEAKTTIGRLGAKKCNEFDKLEYLQLGCGTKRFEDFLNTDAFHNKEVDLNIDLRFPLPLASDAWKGIYAHHVVEHIGYEDARRLFKECFRVLKKGGILRIAVPDVELFLRLYTNPDEEQRKQIFTLYPPHAMAPLNLKLPIEMVNHVFYDDKFNRHQYGWDVAILSLRLHEAGFEHVKAMPAGISQDVMLAERDNMGWAAFSLYMEATK